MLKDKLIMVVEDDTMIRETLKYVLEMEGFRAVVVGNGREALDYLKSSTSRPDLILLDLMMPIMNGYEFRAEQLKDHDLSNIPTVVVSADRSFHQNPQEGFFKTLKKPIELDELLKVLNSL